MKIFIVVEQCIFVANTSFGKIKAWPSYYSKKYCLCKDYGPCYIHFSSFSSAKIWPSFLYFLLCSLANKLPRIRYFSSFSSAYPSYHHLHIIHPKNERALQVKERCKNDAKKDTDWPKMSCITHINLLVIQCQIFCFVIDSSHLMLDKLCIHLKHLS